MKKKKLWHKLDDETFVLQVPDGLVLRYTDFMESSEGNPAISTALVFLRYNSAPAKQKYADWLRGCGIELSDIDHDVPNY